MVKMKRFINVVLPTTKCNLKCHYCFTRQTDGLQGEIPELPYSVDFILSALTCIRLGGPSLMHVSAIAETCMVPYLTPLVEGLLKEGHYAVVVTNGTITKQIERFLELAPELRKRLQISFSFQYLELTRLNMIDEFFNNIKKVRDSNISFTVNYVANDETVEDIPYIKELCLTNLGALCHITESRDVANADTPRLTKMELDKHQSVWGSFNSDLFNTHQQTWGIKRTEFCYSGDWLVNLYLESGRITPCLGNDHTIANIYQNIEEPIDFCAVGTNCSWQHCYCSHVAVPLGVLPSLITPETPRYADIRNRTSDGGEWLTAEGKNFFNTRLYETNNEYSDNKKMFANEIMVCQYSGTPKISPQLAIIVYENLKKRGYNSIAIVGNDKVGIWLVELLSLTKMNVKFVVEHTTQPTTQTNVKNALKYIIKNLLAKTPPLLNINDAWPKVDAYIISDYPNVSQWKRTVEKIKRVSKSIVSILNIVD